MVYTGKPSAGCATCRQRKIRCDETRPTCNQCTKSKRVCGGYPDPDDLIFQHQTSSIIRKVRRAEAAARKRSSASPKSESDAPQELIRNPPESVEIAAVSFYLQSMLIDPAIAGRGLGHLELLPKLYLKASSDSALAKTTVAVCLAVFSNFGPETSEIMRQALIAYGQAVVAIHEAMKDPVARTKNEVLMAVSAMPALESLLAWRKAPSMQLALHVMGNANLLKMRGSQVLDDPVASRIFMVVRHFMQQGSNMRGVPLDPFFAQSISETVKLPDSTETRLSPITRGLSDLRRRTLQALQHPEDLGTLIVRLSELQWMDEALINWTDSVPASYHYESSDSPIDLDDLDFNLQEHHYPDNHTHNVWNSYRCARIFANVLAYRCLVALGQEIETMPHLQNLQIMADEICSSVPAEMRTSSRPISRFHPLTLNEQAVTAFFMLWPLFVARGIVMLPQSQRIWMRKRLVAIAEMYQLRRAMSLVEATDQDERRPLFSEDWAADLIENVWENTFLYSTGAI